jgi:signal peptidase I
MDVARKVFYFFNDLAITIVFAAAIFAVIYILLFRPFQVNGQSMYPTYHHGEYVLTNLIALRFERPQRGDVVVFESPQNPDKDFIKRVIGVPGDKLLLKDGSFYINGTKLDESGYLPTGVKTYGGTFLQEGKVVTIPPGHYFAVGDNRDFSSDSREWGFVAENKVIGKSFFVYWPLDRINIVYGEEYK